MTNSVLKAHQDAEKIKLAYERLIIAKVIQEDVAPNDMVASLLSRHATQRSDLVRRHYFEREAFTQHLISIGEAIPAG